MWINIVADAHIPFVDDLFGSFGNLTLLPGQDIDNAALKNCEALLVRSITQIDGELLRNTPVKFVGTATAGTDHIADSLVENVDVCVANAPAGNAESVVEYVLAAMYQFLVAHDKRASDLTLGIVGYGAIGSRLGSRCEALGMDILRNDPPLARQDHPEASHGRFVSLEALLSGADIVSLHVPFTDSGTDPTVDLIGTAELALMKPSALLINTARGGVVTESALKEALKSGSIHAAVLDVWDSEPDFDCALHRCVQVGTPHIAGYSIDAKLNCTKMIADECLTFFSGANQDRVDALPAAESILNVDIDDPSFQLSVHKNPSDLQPDHLIHSLIDQMYPIVTDHERLRAACVSGSNQRDQFRQQRRHYPRRFSFSRYTLPKENLTSDLYRTITDGLGLRVPHEGLEM